MRNSILNFLNKKLYKYQKQGSYIIYKFGGRALLGDEMGLGKTLQALYYAFKMPSKRPVVIVCPASVKGVWEFEIHQNLKQGACILEGRSAKKVLTKSEFYIINYEILKGWMDFLLDLDPKIVIIDECHYITNPDALRTQYTHELCLDADHVIAISGTPLMNRVTEIWPILNIIRPNEYDNFMRFAWRWTKPKKTATGWNYDRVRNDLHLLNKHLLKTCMIRRRKVEVLKDLPPKSRRLIPLHITTGREEYNKADRDFMLWLKQQSALKALNASKAVAIARMSYLRRLVVELKLPYIEEYIDNWLIQTEEKLVIFGIHTKPLEQLYNKYKKQAVLIYGKVPTRLRKEMVADFQTNPSRRLFFGNIQACGAGITLHAASTELIIELPWNPAVLGQVEDRIHRIGQEEHVSINIMVVKDTIEEDFVTMQKRKGSMFEAVMDGKATVTSLQVIRHTLNAMIKRNTKPNQK